MPARDAGDASSILVGRPICLVLWAITLILHTLSPVATLIGVRIIFMRRPSKVEPVSTIVAPQSQANFTAGSFLEILSRDLVHRVPSTPPALRAMRNLHG